MSVIDGLKQKARDWAQLVVKLHKTPVPAKFQSKKDALMDNALKIKSAIESVTGAMPELAAISQATGLNAVPVIAGVIGVGAAAAYITYWVYQYKSLMKEVETQKRAETEYKRLVESGVSAPEAASVVKKVFERQKQSAIVNSLMKGLIPILLVGGAAYYLMQRR